MPYSDGQMNMTSILYYAVFYIFHFFNYNYAKQFGELELIYSSIWVNIQMQLSFGNSPCRYAKRSLRCLWFCLRSFISRGPAPRIIPCSDSRVTRIHTVVVLTFYSARAYFPSGTLFFFQFRLNSGNYFWYSWILAKSDHTLFGLFLK